MEKPTHEQVLRDAINTDAGVVRTNALVAYLEMRREAARDAVMVRDTGEVPTEFHRGVHKLARDLLTILTTENP